MLGGFINTMEPYNDVKLDQILFITKDIIDIIDNNIAQVIILNQINGKKYKEKKKKYWKY